jgi:single-strand DNA-binding protein
MPLNTVTLVGRVGRDPEMKYFESGRAKTSFSVAVNRPTKEKETDWFDCEVWGRQAEIAGEYVKKGIQIAIDGSLRLNSWTDDEGNHQSRPIINVNEFRMLGSKKDNE